MKSRKMMLAVCGMAAAAILGGTASPAGAVELAPAAASAAPVNGTAHSSPTTAPMTVPGAPTDHYSDAGKSPSTLSTAAAVNLPFNYTFNVQYSLDSREFYPRGGRACVGAQVTSGIGQGMTVQLFDVFQQGPTVNWSTNGSSQVYCFTGLTDTNTYYFRITHTTSGPALVGSGMVSS